MSSNFPNAGTTMTSYPKPLVPSGGATAVPTAKPTTKPTTPPTHGCDDARRMVACPESQKRYDDVPYDNDGGFSGFTTIAPPPPNAGNGNVYAAMEVLTNVTLNQVPSGDAYNQNTLYAPTTHGPAGDCLEMVTGYSVNVQADFPNTQTYPMVAVYDFCTNNGNGGFIGNFEINQSFLNQYVATFSNGNGTPEYVAESIVDNSGSWHYLIWDVENQKYDDLYDTPAGESTNVNNQEGWSIFETHYAYGPCSSVPSTSVSGLRYYVNNQWQYATTATPSTGPSASGGTPTCFQNTDGSGDPFYQISNPTADYGWSSTTYN